MKNIKKNIITFIICILLICIGYKISIDIQPMQVIQESKITLNGIVFSPVGLGNYNEMEVLNNIKKKMGIEVNFNQINSARRDLQKIHILQMEEVPDFIMGGDLQNTDILGYIQSERIIPLNELIEKYAPNIQALLEEKPFIKSACTFLDNKIYTLPFYNEMDSALVENYLFINKVWLDQLGLQIPTTIDEFYNVLKAFKTQDPNGNGKADEIPFSYIDGVYNYSMNSFIGSFGVINGDRMMMVQDENVLFTPAQEGYKEAILYLRKLYQEGLLDAEIFTQDIEQYVAKGMRETPVVGAFLAKDSTIVVGEERGRDEYIVIPPLKGPSGTQLWGKQNSKITTNQFMITSSNLYPEITMAWIDQFFNPENIQELIWGAEGVTFEKSGGNYRFICPPLGKSYAQYSMENSPLGACPGIFPRSEKSKFIFNPMLVRHELNYKEYSSYLIEDNICRRTMFMTDFMGMGKIYNSLNRYVVEMKIRWISGEYDIEEEWESYLSALENMGMKEYVAFYQEKYNKCKCSEKHSID